ncbi:SAVED domain-containing protein [Sinorhizobium meliloti]|uniref:HNH endonuclease n=1 Tax=Rhizobium meliloti TaxID=382 RepID=UPI000FD8B2D3|nr:HNH endonuclease [Sinorhizobium meliloti]MDW9409073.1 SAVED domain-containing protein [Sinorhizobium meliloti]MDW9454229.1 SAVED domain-containing protein [Sinorhizobium meliloti]MDW9466892.1 SAVED domain-containing protein [Sinorhizobium meliloti]MDW9518396.1 SAVED domain-containing protein [Sinorhizobium meliloti]MDW9555965.1 SAVED domain-containing protein [Sinorhizobium meliloti]
MAKSKVPEKIQRALWARAAGRCQYRGCNCELIGDLLSGKEDKMFGFVAHIVADSPGGARGHPTRSALLAKALSNLMLLCAKCHRLIDDEAPDDHDEELLLQMKEDHERRVRLASGIQADRASHVIRFGANIGKNEALVARDDIFASMLPDRSPASFETIDLEMLGLSLDDADQSFWQIQQTNLQRQFADKIRGRIERQQITHASIFALAPQPLLIELGRQLCDILPVDVHQRHREPSTWKWQNDAPPIVYQTTKPTEIYPTVALILGLSASIGQERITSVLGQETSVWSMTTASPHNDIMRTPADLARFRQELRLLFATIKATHGEDATINVFPALPVSAAVEVGRVWMPKADLPLQVFDQNRHIGGFVSALRIS